MNCSRIWLLFLLPKFRRGGGNSEKKTGKALLLKNLREVIQISRNCPLNSRKRQGGERIAEHCKSVCDK
nr:MAG TPA: hypothetical protein [Caudoviricetes sp.]